MDVYLTIVDAMGGFNRFWEAAEIARVSAPCYFKFEPGPRRTVSTSHGSHPSSTSSSRERRCAWPASPWS